MRDDNGWVVANVSNGGSGSSGSADDDELVQLLLLFLWLEKERWQVVEEYSG